MLKLKADQKLINIADRKREHNQEQGKKPEPLALPFSFDDIKRIQRMMQKDQRQAERSDFRTRTVQKPRQAPKKL